MGLVKGTGTREYLTIREGKIAKYLGDKKYELFDSVEGYILGLSTRETQYGTNLCIDLLDDKVYQLQIRIKGEERPGQQAKQTSHFIAFAHCSPGIDPSKKVSFTPSLKEIDGIKRSAMFIEQDGKTLKWAFKKGEGMPEPESVFNKKGELVSVDWSEVEVFRMDKVNEFGARVQAVRHVNELMGTQESTTQEPNTQETPGTTVLDFVEDDLPF